MDTHSIRTLPLEELQEIHERYMQQDFPAAELRPFRSMRELYLQGRYQAFGLFDKAGNLLAYACFGSLERKGRMHYLFDYLAVVPERRDNGLGTEFFRMLAGELSGAGSIIGEVEDPDAAVDPQERETRIRRMAFYMRAGVRDTGVLVRLFGVDYRVLELPVAGAHSPEETAEIYEALYRSWLPEEVYCRRVQLRIPERSGEAS